MPVEYLMWAPLVATSLVLYVTLAAGALFSIAHSGWVSPSSRRMWAAAVVLLPVGGAVLWLAASHRHTTAGRNDAGAAGGLGAGSSAVPEANTDAGLLDSDGRPMEPDTKTPARADTVPCTD